MWVLRGPLMPIPKPKKGDTQQAFVSRCMGNDTMAKDYPNQGQRAAICYQAWNETRRDIPRKTRGNKKK
jgi:hypothetical protein